jgi:hypothetical protein
MAFVLFCQVLFEIFFISFSNLTTLKTFANLYFNELFSFPFLKGDAKVSGLFVLSSFILKYF